MPERQVRGKGVIGVIGVIGVGLICDAGDAGDVISGTWDPTLGCSDPNYPVGFEYVIRREIITNVTVSRAQSGHSTVGEARPTGLLRGRTGLGILCVLCILGIIRGE